MLLAADKVRLEFPRAKGGTVVALDDVTFSVEPNEFTVIVGPSGCGKSSLLYLIGGLHEPTAGSIALSGKPVRGPGPDRGMVFQSFTLFPWLTVRENIAFGLRQKSLPQPEISAIVERYIRDVGLTEFADAHPKQLSGGMKQRVALARAMANDPEMLLMDEPFGSLDSQTRMVMQELLLTIWEQQHKTVLFVTHDIDEAILLGDRVIVMTARPGRIKSDIPISLPRPRNPDIVLSQGFLAIKRAILDLLHEEVIRSLALPG
ncbi:MAG TPA: ABC transporter ATP-binding protein [Dongiaceae bacterium]|nr:ABC transporter ATP-binding protein [Dongiaceae bacterium]